MNSNNASVYSVNILRKIIYSTHFLLALSILYVSNAYANIAKTDIATVYETHLKENSRPIILTIDGVDLSMSSLLQGIPLPKTGRGTSYLMPSLKDSWNFAHELRYQSWTGNYKDTEDAVSDTKVHIQLLSKIAEMQQRPLVIVGHSWGSVIAHKTIADLFREKQLKPGSIQLFVTLGSPLSSQNISLRTKAQEYTSKLDSDIVAIIVKDWTNYWMRDDFISGPITHSNLNIHNIELSKTQLEKLNFNTTPVAHSTYWENSTKSKSSFVNCIGLDQKYKLLSEKNDIDSFCTNEKSLLFSQLYNIGDPTTQTTDTPTTQTTDTPASIPTTNKSENPIKSKFHLSKKTIFETQRLLTKIGYNVGPLDGVIGPKTVNSIKDFQRVNGLQVDGEISKNLIAELKKAAKEQVTSEQFYKTYKKQLALTENAIKNKYNASNAYIHFRLKINRDGNIERFTSIREWGKIGGRDTWRTVGDYIYKYISLPQAPSTIVSKSGFISLEAEFLFGNRRNKYSRKLNLDKKYKSEISTSQASNKKNYKTGKSNIADLFHSNKVQGMKTFSTWKLINFKVRDVAMRDGNVYLQDVQVPNSVHKEYEKLEKNFSWDQWFKVTQHENVYNQRYTIICKLSPEEFSKNNNLQEGSDTKLYAKLNSVQDKTIIFDCKSN